jgi:hypothetical protein
MSAVAVVALAYATTILITERTERFARIARQHSGVFPPLASADMAVAAEPERERLRLWSRCVVVWHAEMAQTYQDAARYPWLPVEPDPPEPERPKLPIADR